VASLAEESAGIGNGRTANILAWGPSVTDLDMHVSTQATDCLNYNSMVADW